MSSDAFIISWAVTALKITTASIFSQSHARVPARWSLTWDSSPHVAPLPVPALVALIRRGVPGRSLWRHRRCCSLARPRTPCVPSNPSQRPRSLRGSRALEVKQNESVSHRALCSVHLSAAEPLSLTELCVFYLQYFNFDSRFLLLVFACLIFIFLSLFFLWCCYPPYLLPGQKHRMWKWVSLWCSSYHVNSSFHYQFSLEGQRSQAREGDSGCEGWMESLGTVSTT